MSKHPHPGVQTLMLKRLTFDRVKEGIRACEECPDVCRNKATPTQGILPVLFVGESPSKIGTLKDDIFRGTAHAIMAQWKGEVYETNAISCHSYPPHPRHRSYCRPWLHALIKSIEPIAVLTFGEEAKHSVTEIRSKWPDPEWTLHIFPHPCWVMRVKASQPWQEQEFIRGVETVLNRCRKLAGYPG